MKQRSKKFRNTTTKYILLSAVFLINNNCLAIRFCSTSDGGGVCPDYNKCCLLPNTNTSGCITSNERNGPIGNCCNDFKSNKKGYGTACADGFHCAHSYNNHNDSSYYYCKQQYNNSNNTMTTKQQPRYILFPSTIQQLGQMYGFAVKNKDTNILAYYSSMGSIYDISEYNNIIDAVFIVIHGSGRNADDYLYAAIASSKLQSTYANVLVVAPRFLAKEDGDDIRVLVHNQKRKPMQWNVTDPIAHSWRYGANALPPSHTISSYDAIDDLVEYFASSFTTIKTIIVGGHSAGGQFTHRWALLSSSPSWYDSDYDTMILPKNTPFNNDPLNTSRIVMQQTTTISKIRVVVANPRSFCYLDGRRLNVKKSFTIPTKEQIEDCPNYNKWEWGLEDGGDLIAPYRDNAIIHLGKNLTRLAYRYSKRNVIYLSGANDTETLVRSCEADDFQGKYRRQRSSYYYQFLQTYFGKPVQKRLIVPNVGHDHSLMFTSPSGIEAIFGNDYN